MAEVNEQSVCINFCVRLGKTGSETFEILKQAFGDLCMSRSRTFEWFGRFKNGRPSTANDDRSGRVSTATTPSKLEQVRAAVNQDRRCTIHDLCSQDPKNHYVKIKLKLMLICFFDQEGIVHREFVPPGMTVNADFYCDVLRRLRENVQRKRPQKWRNQNLIIHHDNAPAHRSFKVSQFLAKNNMTVIAIPISPNLALCDFFLFPKLKLRMKGRTFDTIEEFQEESQRVLDTIPKRGFQWSFQAW